MKRLLPAILLLSFALPAPSDEPRLTDEQIATFQRLGKEADAAYKAQDWAGCVSKYDGQLAIWAGNEMTAYNMACCLALSGDEVRALEMLQKSVELGFRDRDHMAKDTDLDTIRKDPAFARIMKRAGELDAADAKVSVDPLAGPTTPVSGLDTIDAYFREAGKKQRPLAAVLGQKLGSDVTHKLLRSRVAALREYAAAHPAEREAAELKALQAMAAVSGPSETFTKAADAFVAAYPESPRLAAALLLQADARSRTTGKAGEEAEERSRQALVKASREVVARFPDSADSRDAYGHLAVDALRRGAPDEGMPYYRKLKERWPDGADHKEFWQRTGYELFEYQLRDEGPGDFSVVAVNGEKLSLATFKGKVTLLEFWATWCAPCREEIPNLKATYAKYHDRGFEIVGASADEQEKLSLDAFKKWIAEKGMPWPQFYDGKGFGNELVAKYRVRAIPTSFLLDRDGKVVAAQLRGKELEKKVAELLGAGS